MKTQTIKAREVRGGHTVTAINAQHWREDIRPVNGQMPTVTSVEYRENGDCGQPTVYVTTSDDPGSDYCLRPDDEVTVVVTS